MDASRLAACWILASTVLAPVVASHAAEIPTAEAFGAIPAVSEVELSPDGKLLAWGEPVPKGQVAVIYDLDAHVKKRSLGLDPESKLRSLQWADNETLLITVSAFVTYGERSEASHYEVFRTYSYDLSTGKFSMLLMGDGTRQWVTGARLLASRTPKPKTVIMSTMDFSELKAKQQTGTRLSIGRKDEGWVSFIYQVDTRTGKGTPIESGTAFTLDWVVNRNGEPVARSEWNPASELFTIEAKASLGWKEIFRSKNEGVREIYGLTSDETASSSRREPPWVAGASGHCRSTAHPKARHSSRMRTTFPISRTTALRARR